MKQKELNWYDPTKIKSYNKTLNFVIGDRGIGNSGKRRWMADGKLNSKDINYLPYGVFK